MTLFNSRTLALSIVTLASINGLFGCASIFSSNKQNVEIRTNNEVVGDKLDNEAKFTLISNKYRIKHEHLSAGQNVMVGRNRKPLVVRIEESECILPSEERFGTGVNPMVILDVLATSLLSTSIDSSTGALWRYDETLYVTPKIKDTPECQKWLEEVKAKYSTTPSSKKAYVDGEIRRVGFEYDEYSEIHPYSYEEKILKQQKQKSDNNKKISSEETTKAVQEQENSQVNNDNQTESLNQYRRY